jgi:predicted nucleic acid-binding protein
VWNAAEEVACVSIGYVEVRGAIARRLSPRAGNRARGKLDGYWQAIETVAVDDALVGHAAQIADVRRLRTLDALHLAAAERVREVGLVVATWDAELGRAARDAGFATVPA